MSYPIRNDKLLREAYEAGRRQALSESIPKTPAGYYYDPINDQSVRGQNPYGDSGEPGLHPDGTWIGEDGAIVYPDGTVINSDGSTVYPDGTIINPDGTIVHPDGTVELPSGWIMHPDGTMESPDGQRFKPSTKTVPMP